MINEPIERWHGAPSSSLWGAASPGGRGHEPRRAGFFERR